MREYLAVLDDAAFGAARDVKPKFTSHSDPAAQWTGAMKGHAFFAYATNYLVDTDNAIIVDVEATRAIRQAETGAARTMIDRTMDRFGLYPERLIADSAHGSAPMLEWLVEEHGIEPHIPVFDKSKRTDGTFERADFTYDHRADVYMSRRQDPAAAPEDLQDAAPARRRERNDALPRAQAGLQRLCLEAEVLPEAAPAQGSALDPRGRPPVGPRHRRNRGIRDLVQASKEGRDAVRTPQAHSPARQASIARAIRRGR